MRPYLLLLAVLVVPPLASCRSTAPVEVPREVLVQVPVPCVKPEERPKAPVVRTEADLMAMDRYRRTLAAWSDLKKQEAYAAELAAIVEACSRLPAAR